MIINTAQGGGGSDLRLKVYAQPTEPAEKDGVWLKTALAEKIKKIVFDSNVWAAEQWQNPSLAADMPTARSEFCSAVFGDEIYIFGGRNTSSSAG
ncbi:Kelch repeat-containing protein, partial [Caproiciproducens sp.]